MKKIFLLKNETLRFTLKAFSNYETALAAEDWYNKRFDDYSYSIDVVTLDDYDLEFYSK